MPSAFDTLFDRGDQALSQRENSVALVAFEAALAIARAPEERARVLTGIAIVRFRNDENERALGLLDQAIAACRIEPITDSTRVRLAHAAAEAWYEKASILIGMGRNEEALEMLDSSLSLFLDRVSGELHDTDAIELRRIVVSTMSFKGSILNVLERLPEAMACRQDLIRRFQAVDDVRVQRNVARSMGRLASLFPRLGRQDKEIAAYDDLVARFGESDDRQITETVLEALESKMQIYRDQDDLEMVVEICDEIIRRYGTRPHWRPADAVARTMVRRAVALGKQGDHGKELAGYDAVVGRFGESPEPMLRLHGAKALMFKAVTLNDADQSAAEIDCYDEVIRRYGEDPDNEVRVVAADALVHKGFSLGAIAEDAAQDTGVREIDAEIACYDAVLSRYGEEEFIGLRRAVAEALLHKGETLMEVGRTGEAIPCLDSLIAAYALVEDADIQEVVKDARALKAQL